VDVKADGPLTNEIDASLFEDDDGTVYFVYQNGKIARMNDDMTGLADEPRLLAPANHKHVGFEGACLFKANGRYHLVCADFIGGSYHCMVASADSLMGPYGDRYLAVPHAGHNMFFRDRDGALWSTFFGNDRLAPFRERPALVRVTFDEKGRIGPVFPEGFERFDPPFWRYTLDEPAADWASPDFDDGAWKPGSSGFGKADTPGALPGTGWTTSDIWIRRTFELESTDFTYLHLRIHHDEDAAVFLNGTRVADLSGYTTGYTLVPLEGEAAKALKKGPNTIAIHCHQTSGGQYIDAGLVDLVKGE
jgi:hypothetical protein